MVSTSLKPLNETMSLPPRWIPSTVQWHNYPDAIHAMGYFWRYAGNSLFLCLMTVIGTVTSSALAAYGFSRIEWKGRDKVFLVLLATMMIPFPVIMVPILQPVQTPRLDRHVQAALGALVLRRRVQRVPAAPVFSRPAEGHVRGRAHRRLQRIADFLADHPAALQAGAAGGGALPVHGTWNDFLGPLIYLTEQKDFTLALGLQSFQSQQGGTAWHHLMAASTLVVLPVIVLFFLAQRTFIEGIATTGRQVN